MAKQGLAGSKVKLKLTPKARPARGILNSARSSSTGSDSQFRERIGAEYSKIRSIYTAMPIEELAHVAALNFVENTIIGERVDALCSRIESLDESLETTSVSQSKQIKEMVLTAHHLGFTSGRDKSNKLASKKGHTARYGSKTSDPKQLAKSEVKNEWEKWQNAPADYNGDTEFANDMRLHYPVLESVLVITRWCRAWRKTTTVRAE
jgi:hypothetical protein